MTRAAEMGWRTSRSPNDAVPGSAVVWSNGGAGHVASLDSKVFDPKNKSVVIELNNSEMNRATIIPAFGESNAISPNFGRVTPAKLAVGNLNRGREGSFKLQGFVLPVRR